MLGVAGAALAWHSSMLLLCLALNSLRCSLEGWWAACTSRAANVAPAVGKVRPLLQRRHCWTLCLDVGQVVALQRWVLPSPVHNCVAKSTASAAPLVVQGRSDLLGAAGQGLSPTTVGLSLKSASLPVEHVSALGAQADLQRSLTTPARWAVAVLWLQGHVRSCVSGSSPAVACLCILCITFSSACLGIVCICCRSCLECSP